VTTTMTREEAIDAIIGVWTARDSEFFSTTKQYEKSELELRNALIALGVTEEEIKCRL
jgi:hypothetical protein